MEKNLYWLIIISSQENKLYQANYYIMPQNQHCIYIVGQTYFIAYPLREVQAISIESDNSKPKHRRNVFSVYR